MKHLIVAFALCIFGCSSPTEPEPDTVTIPPSVTDSSGGTGGGYYGGPCGMTYKLVFPMPDGSKIVKYVPVYCKVWDGDMIDPPPNWTPEEHVFEPVREVIMPSHESVK
jgi:hypothetical protein